MLVTGAKRPDNIDNLVVEIGSKRSFRRGDKRDVHPSSEACAAKIFREMYMKNMKAQIGDYYKSKQ